MRTRTAGPEIRPASYVEPDAEQPAKCDAAKLGRQSSECADVDDVAVHDDAPVTQTGTAQAHRHCADPDEQVNVYRLAQKPDHSCAYTGQTGEHDDAVLVSSSVQDLAAEVPQNADPEDQFAKCGPECHLARNSPGDHEHMETDDTVACDDAAGLVAPAGQDPAHEPQCADPNKHDVTFKFAQNV